MPNKELLDKENKTILEILKTIQQYGMGALSKKEMTELIEADKTNWGDNIDEFIKEQEAITSGELDGEYLSVEQRKAIVRKRRMNVSKFLGKEQTTTAADTTGTGSLAVRKQTIDPAKLGSTPAPEKTQESLAIVLRGIDSIVETLKAEKKQDKKHFSFLRRMVETFKRRKKENKLEFKVFDGLKKTATKLLTPFKSAWSQFLEFIGKVLLGRVLFKILEWMGNKENQGKLQSIIKFFKDWWPTLLAGYLLFGTGFTSMAVGLVKVVAFGTTKLLGLIPKLMTALAKLKLGKLLKMIPGGALLKGALLLGGGVLATYGIGKMMNKDKVSENLAVDEVTKTDALVDGGMDAGSAKVLADSTRLKDAGGSGSVNNMRTSTDMLGLRNNASGLNDYGSSRFAQGGFVSGPAGVDKVPARLTAGEFVMSKGAVQKYGTDTLSAMNAAGGGTNRPTVISEYNKGGSVNNYFNQGGSVSNTSNTSNSSNTTNNNGGSLVTKVIQKFQGGGQVRLGGRSGAKMRMEATKITPIEKKKVTVAYAEEKQNMADKPNTGKSGQEIPSFNVTAMRSPEKIKLLGISV